MSWSPPAGISDSDARDLERLVNLYRGLVQRHRADFETLPEGKALVRAQMRLGYAIGEAEAAMLRLDRQAPLPDKPVVTNDQEAA